MKKIFFFILLFVNVRYAFTQNHTVLGKITDEKGNPVVSATVLIKNTRSGTVSGTDGLFSLMVGSLSDTLIITSIGYLSRIIPVSDSMNIMLKTTEGSLSEIQIVGYGSVTKTNLTGSAATIKSSYLEDKPFSSVDKTLQGAVAGVASSSSSGAPGSMTGVIIRGFGSLGSNQFPLWVIDGAIATTGDQSLQTTTANTLSSLNPDDIESIAVLKDAATTAVYGSRASNGVIIVTTKKGKAGKTRINFSGEEGVNSIAYKPSNVPITTLQYQSLLRMGVINAGIASNNDSADMFISDPNGMGINPDYTNTNTNWLGVVSQNGHQSQYNVSLAGGDAKTQFYMSAGFYNAIGTTISTNFKRYNGSLSLSHKIDEKLIVNAGLSGSAANQNTPENGSYFKNPVLEQVFLLPWYSPYNPDGTLNIQQTGEFPPGNLYNPVAISKWNTYNYKQNSIRGNVSVLYSIINNLKFTSLYSAEYFDILEDSYQNPIYGPGYPTSGSDRTSYQNIFDWTWTNMFDYKQTIADGINFDIKVGYEAYDQNVYNLLATGYVFPDNLSLQHLTSAATPIITNSNLISNSTNSFFSLGDVNYKDRYVISGSFRRDGSSRFGADNKWGNFYSVGGAWNINQEAFIQETTYVNLLKLRASYGTTGNQEIGDYTSLATFGYLYPYTGNPGGALTNVGDPALTWEKCSIFNVGLDMGLLKNRLSATIEYYNRNSNDLIIAVPLSLTSGVLSQPGGSAAQNSNAGAVNNKGYEITLGGRPVVTTDFSWNINFNIAHNKNKVTQLYMGNPIPNGPSEIAVGHDIFEYYMPIWAGVNPKNGTPLWYTDGTKTQTTGDYLDSAQYSFNGKAATPQYFGSLTNTFSYKGFTLNIQLYYVLGNYLEDVQGGLSLSDGALLGTYNQLSQELTAWQKPGDKTDVPQIILGGNNNSNAYSSRFLYKGDYVRLRDLTLNYSISNNLLKHLHITNLSVYVRCTNLLTFVKDKNLPFDPEEGASQANFDVYQPKTIAGGLKIGL
jgi:TonB-linked SusC/RagA family outer membrane protein